MIRNTVFTLIIAFLAVYSLRDWYKSLCGLIIFMAVISHPDLRGSIAGIQGFNRWNILMIFVLLGWLFHRHHEKLAWDMPRHINILLFLFLSTILIGFYRMIVDYGKIIEYAIITDAQELPSRAFLYSEYLINSIKWILPGLLLFHGCNSRSRFILGVCSLLAVYFLLGVQVIKWMPLGSITDVDVLSGRSAKILRNEIGYHRVNLSVLLAGASWAIFSTIVLVKSQSRALAIILAGLIVIFAQALTAGRAGYVAWAGVGLFLCFFRWRRILLFIPVVAVIVFLAVPGVWDRLTEGMSKNLNIETYTSLDASKIDAHTLTSGRNVAWPYELDAIGKAPFFGYGRMAMQRTGLSAHLLTKYGEEFPHPHQAYLEWLMDNGLVGFLPVFIFFIIVVRYSISLLRDNRSPVFIAIGGITLSIVCALLIGSFGSQTFYPREGAVAMWCAMGLMFRVHVERSRLTARFQGNMTEKIDDLFWKSSNGKLPQ